MKLVLRTNPHLFTGGNSVFIKREGNIILRVWHNGWSNTFGYSVAHYDGRWRRLTEGTRRSLGGCLRRLREVLGTNPKAMDSSLALKFST